MSSADLIRSWLRTARSVLPNPISIHFPGSGSIGAFTYQPQTVWEAPSLYRGDVQLEHAIYSNVASPGKQLGKLADAILAIVDSLDPGVKERKEIKALRELHDLVEPLKQSASRSAEQAARSELEKLLQTNQASLQTLIKEFELRLKRSGERRGGGTDGAMTSPAAKPRKRRAAGRT